MNAITEFILIIGGLILVALVIAFSFNAYNSQKENGDAVLEQTNRTTTLLQENEWMQYDGRDTKGNEVIAVIGRMKDSGTCVIVDNGNGEVSYVYSDGEALTTPMTSEELSKALREAKKRGGEKYINPTVTYVGQVLRDENTDAILGIKFTKATALGDEF